MGSRFETNIALQPRLIREILAVALPSWMPSLRDRPFWFVGVGTSHHAAEIAKYLWRRRVSPKAWSCHSFEFVRQTPALEQGSVVVLLSHRGTKSFTVEAAARAKSLGAVTVGLTGRGSPWKENLDYRLETSDMEDTGVFTKSLTGTMAWLCRWIGGEDLLQGLDAACGCLESGPAFPVVSAATDLILLGDQEREWVAREAALKLQEAAYLRARPFGLEEFLHGPRVSAGPGSLAVAFCSSELRWETVRRYLKAIEVPLTEVPAQGASDAAWLAQLFWSQRFTAAACRALGLDADLMRTQDARYKKAREALVL